LNSHLRGYLELLRLPAVFTAMADVLMGAWFVSASPQAIALPPLRLEVLLLLMASSICLYLAGMVLNDVCDREQDARERPERPIPSGRVPLKAAVALGFELLFFGVVFGWLASFVSGSWHAGLVATALAGLIVAYDAALKRTWFGAIGMGGCRMLNVLLGMSVAGAAFQWQSVNYYVAGAMGAYVAGVTWFARTEAKAESSRGQLAFGTFVMTAALFALAIFPRFVKLPLATRLPPSDLMVWYVSWGALAAMVVSFGVITCLHPKPTKVQAAVRIFLLSLIPMNAAICLLMQGRAPALGIMILLLPAMYLGRWLYST